MEPGTPSERAVRFARDATQALQAVRAGDEEASDRLVNLVYEELHGIAAKMIAQERPGHTLQATALVHEVWLKLQREQLEDEMDRLHFVRLASRAMRNLLVDHARGRARLKRGYGWDRVTWNGEWVSDQQEGLDVEALHEALERFAGEHPRAAEIVEMRFFGGFTGEAAAHALGISKRTMEREWRFARAWLQDALSEE